MPEDIEEVFARAKLSLFPNQLRDLETDCSCPDWSNPCKHTAAVFYLLGEEFDRDPFLLFKLRGLTREELFELLGYGPAAAAALPASGPEQILEPAPEELPWKPRLFGAGRNCLDDLLGEVRLPEVSAALPKRLGSFPFWRGKVPFLEALEPFYLKAASAGLDVFLGLGNMPAVGPAIPDEISAEIIPELRKPQRKRLHVEARVIKRSHQGKNNLF